MFCHNTDKELIDDILYGEKISLKIPMTRTKKVSF